MSKYTAGPWKAYANAEFSGSEYYPFLVALDYGVGPTNPNVMGCRMSEANAHLIAAAPEMAELLREIRENIPSGNKGFVKITALLKKAGVL